ncbi:flagellar basal body P-ring formation chaperone FlgA [Noviherbaspirillum soli]|uniref:flagellar basal body P-ring formation chaperone FlgA n=1 Tax=Noviherbaspirillum soli TaxID=1064518 RepID=UPI00188D9872|nr:flagellar basal body P-ring formation chaperone FlgA [Noviherbaspirillum soli]
MKPPYTALAALLVLAGAASAQTAPARQDHGVLRQTASQFLTVQAGGLPGQITVTVGAIDPRLNLAACTAPEAFLPNGARAWGKTSVGVRCVAPSPWTVYIPAMVQVQGEYLAAAVPLAQGQTIGPNDIARVSGDLTALPPGIVTEQSQAVGHTVARSVAVGAPLRQDALRSQQAVAQGQVVRLVSSGPGFKVTADGRALANGSDGQVVQVKTQNGQVVSGVARAGGTVEVTF